VTPNLQQQNLSKFVLAVQQAVRWVQTHREQFWAITGTIGVTVLLVAFMVHRRQAQNAEAWTQLGVAQGYLIQGQRAETAKALEQWFTRFQGSSATDYARFLKADLLYSTSDYAGAAQLYKNLAETGNPPVVRPLALSAASAAEEMAGQLPAAQATVQQFLEKYPEHFLAASMMMSQARLAELAGDIPNASALYDRYVILYPQSPWTEFAKARLRLLSAPPSAPTR
jgi:outer membrane protein assembly factor BamD (BamD/ComL family)